MDTVELTPDLDRWRKQFASSIVGQHPSLLVALDTVRRVADTSCGVLLTGESGTGKELFARAVHNASPRADQPYVAVNCAAVPETLIEAELFGHVRGAFTGAVAPRAGKVAAAHGGTLFLDEIGDMPLSGQAKLLRLLQEGTISPVGSDTEVLVDVRIVAATNRDLESLVAEGKFRADLYYRLCVIPVELPPLRERGDDIDVLADELLERTNARTGRRIAGFDATARKAMRAHGWPGNIRELNHAVERAVLLCGRGQLSAADLRLPLPASAAPRKSGPMATVTPISSAMVSVPAPVTTDDLVGGTTLDLRQALEQVERSLIDEALQRTQGNRTEAAALLGLNRTTLVEKLRKYAG